MPNAKPFPLYTDGTNIYTSFDGGATFITITSGGGGTIHTSAPLSGDGSVGTPATIAAGAVALTKLATQADQTVAGNVSGGAASPIALTATQLTALINPATGLLSGASPAGTPFATQGTALTDASATINPASDSASLYQLPASVPLTASRNLTLGVTGSPITGSVVSIWRLGAGAFTYVVKDDGGTTLFTFASGATKQIANFTYNGTHFAFLSMQYTA